MYLVRLEGNVLHRILLQEVGVVGPEEERGGHGVFAEQVAPVDRIVP